MRSETVFVILVLMMAASSDALQNETHEIESRGKKKKIALFIYFADLVIKKIFFLKLIYAFVFWLVLHKAGYFLGWFASYLKQKKEFHPEPPHHYHEYGPPSYGPYRRTESYHGT